MNMTRSLQRSINTMINQAVDNAPYDKTRVGTVLERNDDNTYTIKVDGVIYRKISTMNGFKADIGDVVKVVIPTNNPSQMFISAVRYTVETILIGEIKMYAGNNEPKGWLLCDGRELLINDYPKLYNAIGDTYGTASDENHFVLPDLRDRFPIGVGSSYSLGDTGGSADAIVPYHRHSVPAVTNAITGGSHNHEIKYNTVTRTSGGSDTRVGPYSYTNTGYDGVYNSPTTHTHNLPAHNTDTVGTSGEEVGANIPPYTSLNFLIYYGNTL